VTMSMHSPSRTVLHGHIPDKGVWSFDGKAEREFKNLSIGKDMVLKHEAASDSTNDFLYANTFFANTGGQQQGHTSTTSKTHLGYGARGDYLVPSVYLSPHSQARNVDKLHQAAASSGCLSPPGRKISAVQFDDGISSVAGSAANSSPQRVPTSNGWRLSSSLSASELADGSPSSYRRHFGASRRVDAPWRLDSRDVRGGPEMGLAREEKICQADNRELWQRRAAQQCMDRQAEKLHEDVEAAAWGERWGFTQTRTHYEIPIRKACYPSQSNRVTLTGASCRFDGA